MIEKSYCKDPLRESATIVADFLRDGYRKIVAVTLPDGVFLCRLRHHTNGNRISILASKFGITVVKNDKTVKKVIATTLP